MSHEIRIVVYQTTEEGNHLVDVFLHKYGKMKRIYSGASITERQSKEAVLRFLASLWEVPKL